MDCYQVLGLSRDAKPNEICRAYRVLALKHHPDKTAGSNDGSKFHLIQEAYDTLRDPAKKRLYDTHGTRSSDDELRANVVSASDIEELQKIYPGSADERDDIKSFYLIQKGNMAKVFDWIPFTTPNEETAERLIKVAEELVREAQVPAKKAFEASVEALRKSIPKLKKREAREQRRFKSEYGDASFQELAAKIAENQQRRRAEAEVRFLALTSAASNKRGKKERAGGDLELAEVPKKKPRKAKAAS